MTIRFLFMGMDTPGVNESASSKSATAKPVTLGKQPDCCVSLKKGLHELMHDSFCEGYSETTRTSRSFRKTKKIMYLCIYIGPIYNELPLERCMEQPLP